jgi:hypothetical protein
MRRIVVTLLAAIPLLTRLAAASAQQDAPASRPTQSDQQIPGDEKLLRHWLDQLADRDPAVREAARDRLMSLQRSQLRGLLGVVQEARRSIAPAQAAALQEIVTHVYLSGQSYALDRAGAGFMGVRLRTAGGFGGDFDPAEPDPASGAAGAVVSERIPGFAAYRVLCDGDVIVGVSENPLPVSNYDALINIISSFRAGQTVHLKVARAGKIITVPLTLDPRPANIRTTFNEEWELQVQQADEYWRKHFEPLLEALPS